MINTKKNGHGLMTGSLGASYTMTPSDTPSAPLYSVEKRSETRDTCNKPATIDGGHGAYSCVVKDVSVNGMRVALHGASVIGTETFLVCTQTGERRPCRVVWANNREAGLKFVEPS